MSERGVFAVDRGLFDHPLFDEPRAFSRMEAWLWLLAEAEWRPAKRFVSGQVVDLKRGQLAHSIRFMADAWGWSKSTVARFLDRLKTETMIGTDTGTGILVLTICKYDSYQKVSLPKRDKDGTDTGTGAGQERDRLENSESSESKESPTEISALTRDPTPREILLSVLDEETADAVMKHRKAKRAPLSTPLAARGLVKAFNEYPNGPKAAAEMMVTNGWTGFKREYWDKQPRGSPAMPESALDRRARELAERIENEHGFGRQGSGDHQDDAGLPLLIENHG